MQCGACLIRDGMLVTLVIGLCPQCGADCRTNPLWRLTPADEALAQASRDPDLERGPVRAPRRMSRWRNSHREPACAPRECQSIPKLS